MIVKISDYGNYGGSYFIDYEVTGLDDNQVKYLHDNLDEETEVFEDKLLIKMFFDERLYPFQSEVAKIRMDDFISREEIEMNVFLSGFLEDM